MGVWTWIELCAGDWWSPQHCTCHHSMCMHLPSLSSPTLQYNACQQPWSSGKGHLCHMGLRLTLHKLSLCILVATLVILWTTHCIRMIRQHVILWATSFYEQCHVFPELLGWWGRFECISFAAHCSLRAAHCGLWVVFASLGKTDVIARLQLQIVRQRQLWAWVFTMVYNYSVWNLFVQCDGDGHNWFSLQSCIQELWWATSGGEAEKQIFI